MNTPHQVSPTLKKGLAGSKRFLLWAAGFSLGINLITLAIPLYSIQVFDRVLSSGSEATLFVLTIAVMVALIGGGLLDDIRSRLLIAIGIDFDSQLSSKLFERQLDTAGQGGPSGEAVRDLDNVRHMLTGGGILALFDLPWTPIFIGICFLIHPLLGVLNLVGAAIVFGLAVLNQFLVSEQLTESAEKTNESHRLTSGALSNAETVRALGMLPDVMRRWTNVREDAIASQASASAKNASISALIKFVRFALQASVMATGAWLVVGREVTPGALFAASIISTKALTPIDQIVAVWRNLLSAWQALARVDATLAIEEKASAIKLPVPTGRVTCDALTFAVEGVRAPILHNVSFSVEPGESVGIVGPSAAGKSTLARLAVGALRPSDGTLRLDGAETWSWDRSEFGKYVGYVAQSIQLFEGTVAENIARFQEADSEQIVSAAQFAGVHDLILSMPDGYGTRLDPTGGPLSGGQRQRIALARAVFGDPRLVILDEPNSNLDGEGEAALQGLLRGLKARGTTVIMIAHRPSMLVQLDKVLVLAGGAVVEFGPVAQVMPRIAPGFAVPAQRTAGQAS